MTEFKHAISDYNTLITLLQSCRCGAALHLIHLSLTSGPVSRKTWQSSSLQASGSQRLTQEHLKSLELPPSAASSPSASAFLASLGPAPISVGLGSGEPNFSIQPQRKREEEGERRKKSCGTRERERERGRESGGKKESKGSLSLASECTSTTGFITALGFLSDPVRKTQSEESDESKSSTFSCSRVFLCV